MKINIWIKAGMCHAVLLATVTAVQAEVKEALALNQR